MVAVVNGYVCFTSCDAEKAKQGKDHNAKPGELPDAANKKHGLNGQPATTLGGALKKRKAAPDPNKQSDPSNPAKNGNPRNPASAASLPGDATSLSRVDVFA